MERWPELPDTPSIMEIAQTDEQKNILKVAILSADLGRPFMAPPGVPADRAKALQNAFNATARDKELLAEAAKLGLDVSPVGAEEAMEMLDMLAAAPQDLKDQLRKLQGGG